VNHDQADCRCYFDKHFAEFGRQRSKATANIAAKWPWLTSQQRKSAAKQGLHNPDIGGNPPRGDVAARGNIVSFKSWQTQTRQRSAENTTMSMNFWELALLSAAAYVAIVTLMRIMRRRRDDLIDELNEQAEEEQRRLRIEERDEKRRLAQEHSQQEARQARARRAA
jgi:hypothetical protein